MVDVVALRAKYTGYPNTVALIDLLAKDGSEDAQEILEGLDLLEKDRYGWLTDPDEPTISFSPDELEALCAEVLREKNDEQP
ncbi:MAG: hypothetical protein UY74_C0017G0001 [Candidatus Kaiserbacteria bacterium GW2011_GWC2_52_8b]|uniref:Uncharacterized protein n=2 Tax=Candidatus Kaiseribacteriota TaxID=1752734 RepID=A0A0G1ZSP0_9BACT|nr:MAG: hypothetical protein UY67_C0011G0007 [Candidatus Kaiserbacteria bacterium GW2011_GWA2_52_12]KKW31302.1 MAG: hypothetical protein UY74_C0017G0001 [Candidatus Kaiserbacteria bacterium GW2011_GWC2_52_8b]